VKVVFEVEQAGCESCGKLISAALGEIGAVESVEIDESADVATVVLSGAASRDAVDSALEDASAGAGHAYRVRASSWRALA
jgi:copper chaperone CopZ